MLDGVCERYGWTVEYTLWGVSFLNLMMMFIDGVQVLYDFDKKENKADGAGGDKKEGTKSHKNMNFQEFMQAMHAIKDGGLKNA
jgi:hypothetical protein